MLRAAVAELVLALVTSREHAASVAGDLVEESGRHGRLWFAVALLGVALAFFVRVFGACRTRTLGLLAMGFVAWLSIHAAVRGVGALIGLDPRLAGSLEPGASAPFGHFYLAATLILSGLLAGTVLGARRPVRGVNGAVPLAMFWLCAALALPVVDLVAGTATWYCMLVYIVGLPLLYVAPLLGGAALGGRRWRAREASA